MKKFFKWLGIIVLALFVLGAIGSIFGNSGDSGTKGDSSSQPKAEQPKESPKKPAPKKVAKITKANYKLIKVGESFTGVGGDDYATVKKLLGKPSSKTESSSTFDGKKTKTEIIIWGSLFDKATITVTFTNGHVSDKLYSE